MSMIAVYVNSNGDVARDVFNAIATFMASSTFSSALSIAAMCSIFTALFAYIKTRDITTFLRWFALYFVITVILITPKIDVKIIDTSNLMANYTVDNVPYGIAAPAGFISSMSYALTQGIEDIFHLPDDLSYAKTGVLFGSKIFKLSTAIGLQNDNTKQLFDQYLQNCIVPDIAMHKYAWTDLSNTPDIWQFLADQNPSPLRGVIDHDAFSTCAAVLPKLKKAVADDASNSTINLFNTHLFGRDAFKTQVQMKEALGNAYDYFTHMSTTASDGIIQNMTINALRNGMQNYLAYTGATGALQNYSDSKQMSELTLANFNASNQAFYMLPLMQTVLFLLICCLFPIVMLLSLQIGFGLTAVKSFFYSIIYVCSWPLLFVILNFIMNSSLSFATAGMAEHGITLSNANPLVAEHIRFAGYAGYMILAIPIITIWITKGLAQGMSQAAQYIGGMAHSIAGQVAAEAASGNISLGNASMGNASYNNLSANKHDTNTTNFSGMSTTQLDNGGTIVTSASGESFYQTAGVVSQLPISLNMSQGLSSSLSKSADHFKQQSQTAQTAFSESISQGSGHIEQFGKSINKQTLEGMGVSESESTQILSAMQHMNQIADDVSKRTGMSYQSSLQHLLSSSESGSVSLDSKRTAAGKIFEFVSGVGIDAKAGIENRNSSYSESVHSKVTDITINDRETRDFSNSLNTVKNFATSHHIDSSHSEASNYLSQAMSELRNSETAAKNYSFDEQKASRLSEAASYVSQQGAGISANLMPAFQEYVTQQLGSHSADVLFRNSHTPANIDRLNSMASSFVESVAAKYVSGSDAAIANPGFSSYANKSRDSYDQYTGDMTRKYDAASAALSKLKSSIQEPIHDDQLRNKVENEMRSSNESLKTEKNKLSGAYQNSKNKTTEEIQ